ncbi:MAG: response regulator transcription factor [Leptolyngbyaceae cyanobacterium CSU_1_4]|nr:response regulator transcription factor [Leptolyngbyaceae cyanobacterium CSU_1_4]
MPSTLDLLPVRLLIAEDDPVMQLGLSELFEDSPQIEIVAQVTDGYAAVSLALQLKPNIIIMDIGLPKLDGITATQQIKATLPEMRVVMLTSHQAEQEMIAALASGADAYCVKGTSLEQLLLAIACAQEGATYLDPQIARQIVNSLKPSPPQQTIGQLSNRELEVLKLLVEGKSNPEIAQTLYISLSTAKAHVRNIMTKLAVDDRVQAAVLALRSGLV